MLKLDFEKILKILYRFLRFFSDLNDLETCQDHVDSSRIMETLEDFV